MSSVAAVLMCECLWQIDVELRTRLFERVLACQPYIPWNLLIDQRHRNVKWCLLVMHIGMTVVHNTAAIWHTI